MKNLKVSQKLVVSFSIILALSLFIGGIGIYGMSSINAADDTLYHDNLLAIDAMSGIQLTLQRQRIATRNFVIYSGNEQKTRESLALLGELEAEMDFYMAEYDNTIRDPSLENAYYDAKKLYQNEYSKIKQLIMEASAVSFEAGMAAQDDPNTTASIKAMTDNFAQSMTVNKEWAKNTVDTNTNLFITMAVIEAIALAAAIATSLILVFYISGLICNPLKRMCDFLTKWSSTGDMSLSDENRKEIETYGLIKDEIGQCVAACGKVLESMWEVNTVLGRVAGGDLTSSMKTLSEHDSMGISINKMVDNLNDMFSEIRTASNQVSAGAGQVSQGAQSLASGSSEQAASIEEFNAALAELQEKTDHSAENSSQAREVNTKAGDMLVNAIDSMGEMLEAMKAIDESSSSITKVIKVIDDIAFQTNILALNAAVEAARAGQHGKGFAVVADEVRNLASKSASAAKETAALIEGSSERVKEGNQIVEKTNSNLEAVSENARVSTQLLDQVAAESIEQATSIAEINQGIEQISTVVQANSATAQQAAAASQQMSAQAVVLNEIISKFKLRGSEPHTHSAHDTMNSGFYGPA